MELLTDIDEAPGLRKRVARLRTELEFLLESNSSNMVYWLERRIVGSINADKSATPHRSGMRSQNRHTFLQATPIDVSELLHELVFETIPTAILTSATLTVQGGFEHIRKRLGMTDARELVVPSHFRYGEQALLYLPPNMPDPRDPEFPEAAANCIRRVLEISKGRAFCLFTSYAQMRDLYERLLPVLDYPILLHGTAPRKALLEQFRTTPNAVLFGTSSFWQGVDVQGEALSCVIIDQPALRRPQRSRRAGPHESHRRSRRQALLRLPGPLRSANAEARLRPPHPLARRSRRASAPRPQNKKTALRPDVSRKASRPIA